MENILLYIFSYLLGAIHLGNLVPANISPRKEKLPTAYLPLTPWLKAITNSFDALKAFFVVLVLLKTGSIDTLTVSIVGLAIMLGDCYSFIPRFRGGHGIAPYLGGLAAFNPALLLYLILAFPILVFFYPYRIISFLILTALLPFFLLFTHNDPALLVFSLISLILLITRHYKNILNVFENKEPDIKTEFSKRNA